MMHSPHTVTNPPGYHTPQPNIYVAEKRRPVAKDQTKSLCSIQAISTQTDCIQDTAQKMKLKRLKASIATMTRQTDAEQGRPIIKKLEVKQVEFKLGEDCWEIQVKRAEPIPPTSSVTALRIPMIKKGEYDLWSMKMRQYIAITDHILWDIITNGDQATTDPASSSAPKTSLAANARRNNEKALNILLSVHSLIDNLP
ncbi:hypothetical protein Tco_0190359 [Tanacetum coccineum]